MGFTLPFAAIHESEAFRAAALRSEIRRAYAVIAIVLLVMALVILRGTPSELDPRLLIVACLGIFVIIIIQYAALFMARRAQRRNEGVPAVFNAIMVVLESLIPAAMILGHSRIGALQPYSALVSPPVFMYGLLYLLTALRLRPWMCVLSGVSAATGYGGVLVDIILVQGMLDTGTGLPLAAFASNLMFILVGGLAAAWVAGEIRGHVQAALGEAESRRRIASMEQDLSTARSIQQALLPREAPVIPGFDIAGWNRPADQTGGDYYDWQRMPDGAWIITLADVSGHGIGPAMVTAACRAYMRALAHESPANLDLGTVVTRMNRLLAGDLPDGRFITFAAVVVRPGAHTGTQDVALISAGHGPIALYQGTVGEVRDILPRNMPLAVMPEAEFGPPEIISMAAGDTLAIVTDGLVEWSIQRDDGARVQYGVDRLKKMMHRAGGQSAEGIVATLTADAEQFAGNVKQQDDLTLLVIKRVNHSV